MLNRSLISRSWFDIPASRVFRKREVLSSGACGAPCHLGTASVSLSL
jgi:hypothetical protein